MLKSQCTGEILQVLDPSLIVLAQEPTTATAQPVSAVNTWLTVAHLNQIVFQQAPATFGT